MLDLDAAKALIDHANEVLHLSPRIGTGQTLIDTLRMAIAEIEQNRLLPAARKTIWEVLQKDQGLRIGYISNVSCILMDEISCLKEQKDLRDAISTKILERILS